MAEHKGKTLSYITEHEYKRTKKNLFNIHFIKNGEWLKALEFSAYLCKNLPFENTLNIQKYSLKGLDNGYLHCGCKLGSISKFFNSLEDKIQYNTESNTILSVDIDVSDVYKDSEITEENYMEVLAKFKEENPFSDDNKSNLSNKEYSVKGVMQNILAYPIESRTPIQNIQFLSDLKTELSKFI